VAVVRFEGKIYEPVSGKMGFLHFIAAAE